MSDADVPSVFRTAALICIDHIRDGGKISLNTMVGLLTVARRFPDVNAALKDAVTNKEHV